MNYYKNLERKNINDLFKLDDITVVDYELPQIF
jgi:hypothetical protein